MSEITCIDDQTHMLVVRDDCFDFGDRGIGRGVVDENVFVVELGQGDKYIADFGVQYLDVILFVVTVGDNADSWFHLVWYRD